MLKQIYKFLFNIYDNIKIRLWVCTHKYIILLELEVVQFFFLVHPVYLLNTIIVGTLIGRNLILRTIMEFNSLHDNLYNYSIWQL